MLNHVEDYFFYYFILSLLNGLILLPMLGVTMFSYMSGERRNFNAHFSWNMNVSSNFCLFFTIISKVGTTIDLVLAWKVKKHLHSQHVFSRLSISSIDSTNFWVNSFILEITLKFELPELNLFFSLKIVICLDLKTIFCPYR